MLWKTALQLKKEKTRRSLQFPECAVYLEGLIGKYEKCVHFPILRAEAGVCVCVHAGTECLNNEIQG